MKISQALQAIAIVVVAALSAPAEAHASPTDDLAHDSALFCRQLDQDSTPAGVVAHIQQMYMDGLDRETIKGIVGYSLNVVCPEYRDEVENAARLLVPKDQLA